MIPGTPAEARWVSGSKPRPFPHQLARKLFRERVTAVDLLPGGLRHTNYKVSLHRIRQPLVLRLYCHDSSLGHKEADIMFIVRRSVPVPRVLDLEPGNYMVYQYVDGITFRDLSQTRDKLLLQRGARSVGRTLAAIHRFSFESPGWITAGHAVGAPLLEGSDPLPRIVDLCLASKHAEKLLPPDVRERISHRLWSAAPRFARDACLVHGDFNRGNIIVNDQGEVTAVLDWEFAVAGSPLQDIGSFLRYTDLSQFAEGYRVGGGTLPDDWRELARTLDAVALCEMLTHDHMPATAAAEVAQLLRDLC